jgi:hypothetical protein
MVSLGVGESRLTMSILREMHLQLLVGSLEWREIFIDFARTRSNDCALQILVELFDLISVEALLPDRLDDERPKCR